MQSKVVRGIWRAATFALSDDKELVLPSNFQVCRSWGELSDSCNTASLIACYQEVFRESWDEWHPAEEIQERMMEELQPPAAISLMLKDGQVVGFCWGQVLGQSGVIRSVRRARTFSNFSQHDWQIVELALRQVLKGQPVLFMHELGILEQARGGIQPVQFLVGHVFEMGYQIGIHSAVWWTAIHSRAYDLSLNIGFDGVAQIGDFIFIYTPDFVPILKAIKHFDERQAFRLFLRSSREVKKGDAKVA